MEYGKYQDTGTVGNKRFVVACDHGIKAYAETKPQAFRMTWNTHEFCDKCNLRNRMLMALGGKGRTRMFGADDRLSRCTSDIWLFMERSAEIWEDIDTYGVMHELYGIIADYEETEVGQILAKHGYSAKAFIDELAERTSWRFVYFSGILGGAVPERMYDADQPEDYLVVV